MKVSHLFSDIGSGFEKLLFLFDRWTTPRDLSFKDGLRYWQKRILYLILFACIIIGLFAYIPSVILSIKEKLWFIAILDTVLYLLVFILFFYRKIPYAIKSGIVVSMSYILGSILFFTLGPFGAGPIWLFTSPILAAVLLGMRAAVCFLSLNALTLLGIGICMAQGFCTWNEIVLHSTEKWIVISVNFMLLNIITTISSTAVLKGLQKSLGDVKETSGTLEQKQMELVQANKELQAEIRQHAQAQKAKETTEEKYRAVFQGAIEGIIIADTSNHSVRFSNPACSRMLGYDSQELVKLFMEDILVQNGQRNHLAEILEKPLPENIFDVPLCCKDDSVIHTNITTARIHIEEKEQLVIFFTDITEMKQREEERKKLEARLRQSEKMEAIGTLAGGIAHDFNNILGIIIGNTEMAKGELKNTSGEDYLEEIHIASLRAKELVKQILSFAHKSREEKIPVSITPIIKESMKMLRSFLPTTVEIRQHLHCGSDIVVADSTQIHQILMNLGTNAAHAMKDNGGILGISVDNVTIGKDNQTADLPAGKYVRIRISDTGTGIPPHILDRIFEPYFTTKDVDEGTGMGLAVVHGAIKNHRGTLQIKSEPENGTTVFVYLPCATQVDSMDTYTSEITDNVPSGKERILFVDDEPSLIKMARRMFDRLGYTIQTAHSGLEALEKFQKSPDSFDLVITDMTMPKMTGEKLAARIWETRPDIPVILCSGYSDRLKEDTAKKMGIAAFVTKPMIINEMAKTVRKVLDKRHKE